jgi:hypothetical protein
MALFVLGAGATRGASFVDESEYPCIPPLDRDFFTQLQRVQHKKHTQLIRKVMHDVVDLFGQNFDVTMETVFTTLENTIKMLDVTGENRDFRKKNLVAIRDRLIQAVAVVLEDSLTEQATRAMRSCNFHEKLVAELMQAGDEIISFNYDCLIDDALRQHGSDKWNPRYGYGFDLGSRGSNLTGDSYWAAKALLPTTKTIKLHKLHGSLHFLISEKKSGDYSVALKKRPYTRQNGNLKFTIIPPEWHKGYDKGAFAKLWGNAAAAIHRAQHVIFIGYSLPTSDLHATALFRTSVKRKSLKSLVVVNPDRDSRKRCRMVFQRGLSPDTRVLSFDRLEHFVAAPRATWEQK